MDVVLKTEQAKNPLHIFFKTFAWILNQLLQFLKSLWVPFERTLGEHVTMIASANMFYIAIGYKNKASMKVAASNTNIKSY